MNQEALFRQILKPALGCTEPVAAALATSAAAQAAFGWTPERSSLSAIDAAQVRSLRLDVSRNIFKNSFAIYIPNSGGRKGLAIAAALGLFCNPSDGMQLFASITPAQAEAAERMVAAGLLAIRVVDDVPDVYIRAEVVIGEVSGAALVQQRHTHLACLWRAGEVIYGGEREDASASMSEEVAALKAMRFADLLATVDHLDAGTLELLRETVKKNVAASKKGLEHPFGIGAGYYGASRDGDGLSGYLVSLTAAGSDARMAGLPVAIMSSAGSGNQGMIATLPIVVYAHTHLIDEDEMMRAVAFSHLVTMYLTCYLGYLSALCGVAIKAGIGAACGLTVVMGGGAEECERAVKIMAATLTGMICDGAKVGCALKVSTAADMALRAATLAIKKAEAPADNGVVAETADATIANLAKLNSSMSNIDDAIIRIMLDKLGASDAK